jgi:hypothetical protein
MTSKKVKLIEISDNRWELFGPKGNTLAEGMRLNTQYEAESWVKAYISSFNDWTYEILPKARRKHGSR